MGLFFLSGINISNHEPFAISLREASFFHILLLYDIYHSLSPSGTSSSAATSQAWMAKLDIALEVEEMGHISLLVAVAEVEKICNDQHQEVVLPVSYSLRRQRSG